MFERKTTVKLDQDKKKFLSSNANKESQKVNNPFEKKTFEPVNQKKEEEKPKKDPFMAPAYETKRKEEEKPKVEQLKTVEPEKEKPKETKPPAQDTKKVVTFPVSKTEEPKKIEPKTVKIEEKKQEGNQEDFKNSLAALIGRGKPGGGMKKPVQAPTTDDKIKVKVANIFEEEEKDDFFGVARNRQHTIATSTVGKDVNALEFAMSKPAMANRNRRRVTNKKFFDQDESD